MNKVTENNTVNIICWVIFAALSLVGIPFLTVLSLNTLLGMSIAFTFKTWLSVLWLTVIYSWMTFVIVAARMGK